MQQLPPIHHKPVESSDPLEQLRRDILLGEELLRCPNLLAHIQSEYNDLVYKVSHLHPASEATDRGTAYAVNTVNAKLNVLEGLYNLAFAFPSNIQLLDEYKRQTENTEE